MRLAAIARTWQTLPGLAMLVALSAQCPTAVAGPAPGRAIDAPAVALVKIDRLIGSARCTTDRQCRVAPIGLRPCGGPESHRAWSTRDTRAQLLQRSLQQHAELRRRQHEAEGLMSTCQVLPEPAVRCERANSPVGHCVLLRADDALR